MKNYIFLLAALTFSFVSCSDDDELIVTPEERGTVTDSEGNEYKWVRIGDLCWTTSNALNGTPCYDATYPGSWGDEYVFESDEDVDYMMDEYMPEYGNLMTFEDAMDSAPEGWRLPTDEDWKNLELHLGMGKAVNAIGWRTGAAQLMMQKEGTELNMQLGGGIIWTASYYMILKFMHFKEYGYYWTSTIDESYKDFQAAYYRKLCFGKNAVERRATKTSRLMSVRWVRDVK